MDYKTIIYEKKEKIVQITINRPRVLNAIDTLAIKELTMAFREVQEDDEARVVILTGTGDRAFSTGHDLKESLGDPDFYTPESLRKLHIDVRELMFAIWNLDKPVIARVDGYCLGTSLDLALVCDFTIASEESKFGEPEIREGSASEFPMLPWVLGMKQAKNLTLTGDTISAEEAQRVGMVTRVVPRKELDEEVHKLARKLSAISAKAIKMCKYQINKAFEAMGFLNAMAVAFENTTFLVIAGDEEREAWSEIKQEKGLKAAMEWRDSRFKGLD